MASQTAIVATGANDASNGAASNWSSPGNVTADDGTRATVSLNASTSRYLKGTNCGFTIPGGATINGITVEIEKSESAAGVTDSAVRIVKADGSIGTTDKASATEWVLTTDTISTYGSASDLWGETWSSADVNDADFGVVIAATKATGGAATARVDFIRITVTYTAGTTQDLAGQIDGTSSVTGAIVAQRPLAASVSAAATVTGDLSLTLALAGQSDGVGSLTGTVFLSLPLAGVISGTSSATADLTGGASFVTHWPQRFGTDWDQDADSAWATTAESNWA